MGLATPRRLPASLIAAAALAVAFTGPVRFRVMDGGDGLSAPPGFVPRPAGVGVQGSHTSELVLVARTVTV